MYTLWSHLERKYLLKVLGEIWYSSLEFHCMLAKLESSVTMVRLSKHQDTLWLNQHRLKLLVAYAFKLYTKLNIKICSIVGISCLLQIHSCDFQPLCKLILMHRLYTSTTEKAFVFYHKKGKNSQFVLNTQLCLKRQFYCNYNEFSISSLTTKREGCILNNCHHYTTKY